MGAHHYSTYLFRILAALLAAVYVNLQGQWHRIGVALVTPAFYVALFSSFFVAMLLIYLVDLVSVSLDRRYPFHSDRWKRTAAQLFFGVIIPSLLDVLLMAIYFACIGRKMPLGKFMVRDFPVVFLLLVLLSAHHLWKRAFDPTKLKKSDPVYLTINYNGNHARLEAQKDILFFFRDKKLVRVYTISGKIYPLKSKIVKLKEEYAAANFYQVNPSVLVNLTALEGYVAGSSRDTLKLIFKVQYQEALRGSDPQLLRVTKEHIAGLKKILDIESN